MLLYICQSIKAKITENVKMTVLIRLLIITKCFLDYVSNFQIITLCFLDYFIILNYNFMFNDAVFLKL